MPLALLIILVGKIYGIARSIVQPIAMKISFHTIAGVEVSRLLALILILLGCFLAGLFARTDIAKRMVKWVEDNILVYIPGYAFLKSIGEDMAGLKSENLQRPVLAWIEESWQIGFLVEKLDNDFLAVYVPGVPSPRSGTMYFLKSERVRKLDITPAEANAIIRKIGIASAEVLKNKLPDFENTD